MSEEIRFLGLYTFTLIELLRADNGQFQKSFFLHYPKKVSMKMKKKCVYGKLNFVIFWVEKCCEYISYSYWTIIRGPCMNNIKMRNSSNRDALLLKWWLFDIMSIFCYFLCVWYVKFILGLSGNVSIKHSSSRSLSPNHTLFLSNIMSIILFLFLRHRSFTISWICF